MKIAMFKDTEYGITIIRSDQITMPKEYVRITDWVDVEFTDRTGKEVIKEQVDALGEEAKKVQAACECKLTDIKRRSAELQALTYDGAK